jgi:hypothetical protein
VLVEDDVRAEILDGKGDLVPQPLPVGDRRLAWLDLQQEVDVTTPEIIVHSGAEEPNRGGGAEDLWGRASDM